MHLDLRHRALTTLAPELLDHADTLDSLDVSGNALTELPDTLPRLHRLRVLFASNNAFTTLPTVLGRCPALEIVGFKANRIRHVPAEALPPTLRWLILTDNQIDALPETLGHCAPLQKLMLAGNRLRRLPQSLANCQQLELVRLAANAFETTADALPPGLLALPRLAWLAHGGNPFSRPLEQRALAAARAAPIPWSRLQLQGELGQGASGVIHAARWQPDDAGAAPVSVAVKVFKGAVTSDGLPESEMAACIAAGTHPNLVGLLAPLAGHPSGASGLVLPRIPAGYANLAGPPSLATCSRDVYPAGLRLSADAAASIANGVRAALSHLHGRGLTHGDVYGHNLLVEAGGHALLGDFGAASFLPEDEPRLCDALLRIEGRAMGVLEEELTALRGGPQER